MDIEKNKEDIKDNFKYMHFLFLIWVVMFVAKVTNHIDWSWWVVFIPLYPYALVLSIISLLVVIAVVLLLFGVIFEIIKRL